MDGLNINMGPTIINSIAPIRIEPPSFGEELSEEELSDEGNDKPLGIEEFKQRVENMKRNDNKKKKSKGSTKK